MFAFKTGAWPLAKKPFSNIISYDKFSSFT
jgi:hypothetical protein